MSVLIARTTRAPADRRAASSVPRRVPASIALAPRPAETESGTIRAAGSTASSSGSWTSIECSPSWAPRSTRNGGPRPTMAAASDVVHGRRPGRRSTRSRSPRPRRRSASPRGGSSRGGPPSPSGSRGLAQSWLRRRPQPAAAGDPGVDEAGVRHEDPHRLAAPRGRVRPHARESLGGLRTAPRPGRAQGVARRRVEHARPPPPCEPPAEPVRHPMPASPSPPGRRGPPGSSVPPSPFEPVARIRDTSPRPGGGSGSGSRGAPRAARRTRDSACPRGRARARCRRTRTGARRPARSRPPAAASRTAWAARPACGTPGRTGSRATASPGPSVSTIQRASARSSASPSLWPGMTRVVSSSQTPASRRATIAASTCARRAPHSRR